ncbi:MAG: 4Fe-4S dicluster domain-containing protein [Pseudomonadota bacterium]
MNPAVADLARGLRAACVDCGLCVKRCAFLGRHGSPGQMAAAWLEGRGVDALPFLCSLCGLCQALCPTGAAPPAFFQAWRAQVAADKDWRPYRALLGYQNRGARPAFSHHLLPAGCDTVFFPGCTLPGQRPDLVWRAWRRLSGIWPGLGLVLDCCWRPAAMLGRMREHRQGQGRLAGRLTAAGVREVWAACPNCLRALREDGPAAEAGLRVRDVYSVLLELDPPVAGPGRRAVSLHDPCASRFDDAIQAAARGLVAASGRELVELAASGRNTICCGEGGAVAALAPELASAWLDQRRAGLDGLPLFTYCAGCMLRYRRAGVDARHLLDLVLPAAQPRPAVWPPLAYLNRHRLVRRLRRLPADTAKPGE